MRGPFNTARGRAVATLPSCYLALRGPPKHGAQGSHPNLPPPKDGPACGSLGSDTSQVAIKMKIAFYTIREFLRVTDFISTTLVPQVTKVAFHEPRHNIYSVKDFPKRKSTHMFIGLLVSLFFYRYILLKACSKSWTGGHSLVFITLFCVTPSTLLCFVSFNVSAQSTSYSTKSCPNWMSI